LNEREASELNLFLLAGKILEMSPDLRIKLRLGRPLSSTWQDNVHSSPDDFAVQLLLNHLLHPCDPWFNCLSEQAMLIGAMALCPISRLSL
jgi:hypothetical protein